MSEEYQRLQEEATAVDSEIQEIQERVFPGFSWVEP